MSQTRTKLDEAEFFLEKMRENVSSEDFDNFLNAYVSSARSVLWVMRAEYSKIIGWQEWFSSIVPTEEEAELLVFTANMRNTSQKLKPIKSHFDIVLNIPKEYAQQAKELERLVGMKGTLTFYLDEEPKKAGNGIAFKAKLDHAPYRKVKDSELPILDICEQYIVFLSRLVQSCENKFGVPKP